jgi:MFS family permease
VRPVAAYLRSLDPRLPREVYALELGALVNAFGRYTAAASISWQIGWILGPAAGGFLLQHRPLRLWPIAAGVNLACAAAALALEPRLPERVRRTPRAEPAALPIPASG